jgi:hypothetical protein
MPMPKLSICLPTYNRIADLQYGLGFLFPQVAALPAGQVEVVIVNNASTDDTAEWINTLPVQYAFVRIFHNASNLGFDGNTVKCIEHAQGDYLALLSDDDIYLPGQITALLNAVASQAYALINLNYYSFLTDPHRPYETYAAEIDRVFPHAHDILNYPSVGHYSGFVYKADLARAALAQELALFGMPGPIGRPRGINFRIAARISLSTELPALFLGHRYLAVKVPARVNYEPLSHVALDTLNGSRQLLAEGLFTPEDVALRRRRVLAQLPQLIITSAPHLSADEIRRLTAELSTHYPGEWRFRLQCWPLLRAAEVGLVRRLYRWLHQTAQAVKRARGTSV